MKKMIKIVAVLIGSVVVILLIISQILFKNPLSIIYIPVWIIEARKGIEEQYNKSIRKEEENREENRILAEKWLFDTYGDIISGATTIEFSNRSQGWGIDSVFHIESPFATGSIYVNSETKEVDGGFNLSGIKFQHLYSNWVKKQVGIDDENVEFLFTDNFENPYIEFDKIETISNDYREVFENTHNLAILEIRKQNINELEKNNWMDYAGEFVDKYDKLKKICDLNPIYKNNAVLLYLYKYEKNKYSENLDERYYGTYDNPNNIGVLIENGKIYKDLAEFVVLENEKEVNYVIDNKGHEVNEY